MDPIYKRLYSSARMVEDLLRAVAPALAARIDFASLAEVAADYAGESSQLRRGDKVWRAALDDPRLGVLLPLEFQSDKARGTMPARLFEYTGLLLMALHRDRRIGAPGTWPVPLPIVLYGGDAPWTDGAQMRGMFALDGLLARYAPAQESLVVDLRRLRVDDMPPENLTRAVAGFEQAKSPADLAGVAAALAGWLRPSDAELKRAFRDWLAQMAARLAAPDEQRRLIAILEDGDMTLVERVAEWPGQWHEKGRREGRMEGRMEGERSLLRRMAVSRFGAAAGPRLASRVAAVSDPERLAEVGECLVAAGTEEEFLARLTAVLERRAD